MSEISRCDEFSFGYYNTILFKKKTFLLISLRKFRIMKRWSARRVKIVYKTFDSSLWERERSPETPWQEAVLQWRNAKSVANVEKMQKIEKNQKKLLTFPQICIILTYVIEAWLSLVERCVRDAEVASSNLVASTYTNQGLLVKRSRRRPLTA